MAARGVFRLILVLCLAVSAIAQPASYPRGSGGGFSNGSGSEGSY